MLCELPILPAHLLGSRRRTARCGAPRSTSRRSATARSDSSNAEPVNAGCSARNDAFPAALGGPPRVAGFVVSVVDEPTTKFAGLASGDLDVAGISPAMAPLAARDPSMRVLDYPVLFTTGLVFNVHKPPFDDARVRRAISLSIDRERIVDAALAGFGRSAAGPVPPESPLALDASSRRETRARRLAARCGRMGRAARAALAHATARRVRARSPHRRQRRQRARAARASRPRRARHSRQHSAGGARHVSHTRRAPRTKTFDVLVAGVPGDVALAFVGAMFETRQAGGALDYTGFHSRQLDSLFVAAREPRALKRSAVAAWQAVQRTACRAEMPVAWIYHSRGLQGISARLRNVVDGSPRRDGDARRLEHRDRAQPWSRTMSLLDTTPSCERRRRIAAGPLRPLAAFAGGRSRAAASRASSTFPRRKGAAVARRRALRARRHAARRSIRSSRSEHRCPRCGEVYRGELHDRFWIYWYQLWLAERAVHGGALARLGDGDRFAQPRRRRFSTATSIGTATYPNVDNVLGPTRLFFSTYLESIWLLQICVATDLLDARNPALADRVRDRIVEPSRAIIAEFDEGGSNRQVWNDAALLRRASLLVDDAAQRRARRVRPVGRRRRTSANGLFADGTWYEGENYHLFAHRGLVVRRHDGRDTRGYELPAALVDRFQRGFSAPFVTALPDFTLPSRRDSQYAISLRQWRIAEHCELGLARARRSDAASARCSRIYRDDVPRGDTGAADRRPTSSGTCRRRRSRVPI